MAPRWLIISSSCLFSSLAHIAEGWSLPSSRPRPEVALVQLDARVSRPSTAPASSPSEKLEKEDLLSEARFQEIVAKRSDALMKEFALQIIKSFGGTLKDASELDRVVPSYSGVEHSRSFEFLLRELAVAPWIVWSRSSKELKSFTYKLIKKVRSQRHASLVDEAKLGMAPGALAMLNQVGYDQVADVRCDNQMEIFIRRVISAYGGTIIDEQELKDLVSSYSGVSAMVSYETLIKELEAATWISGFSNPAGATGARGATVPLDKDGYAFVVELGNKEASDIFLRRVVGSVNAEIVDAESMLKDLPSYFVKGAAKKSYTEFLAALTAAPWVKKFKMPETATALNEDGYREVATLRKNGEMGKFVRKLLASRGARVSDTKAFQAFLPQFSGRARTQTFAALEAALEKASFVSWTAPAPEQNIATISSEQSAPLETDEVEHVPKSLDDELDSVSSMLEGEGNKTSTDSEDSFTSEDVNDAMAKLLTATATIEEESSPDSA